MFGLTVLQVFDVPNLSIEDRFALHTSMDILFSILPSLAAQVVAACADPDPRVAFAALVCTKMLLADQAGNSPSKGARPAPTCSCLRRAPRLPWCPP